MSRIDINIEQKESGECLIHRGFCRNTHLAYFCEGSPDSKINDFADLLFLGVDITENNIVSFTENLEYVLFHLKDIEENVRESTFSFYKKELFDIFVEDLENSLLFLQNFQKETDINTVNIEIV